MVTGRNDHDLERISVNDLQTNKTGSRGEAYLNASAQACQRPTVQQCYNAHIPADVAPVAIILS